MGSGATGDATSQGVNLRGFQVSLEPGVLGASHRGAMQAERHSDNSCLAVRSARLVAATACGLRPWNSRRAASAGLHCPWPLLR
jgi:hypothetical protein